MASKQLTFEIFGKDKSASKTIDTVSDRASKMGAGVKRAAGLMASGLAIAAGAAVAFGLDSVKAYAEAEESQNRLKFALQKFPAGLTTNTKELGKLNSALAKKTRYDDDATASGQAVLAQFGLTGDQLKKITPLLQDYASSTGKDLPSAAEDLGKALLGQGRSLKQIGLDFDDTGSLAGNFDSVMQGLSTQVGGFAEKEGQTAIGKLETMRNRFGEIEEKIGEALMPALDNLATAFETTLLPKMEGVATWIAETGIPKLGELATWVDKNGNLVAGLGATAAAFWVLNAAMDANPVGAVILGFAALAGMTAFVVANWREISTGFAVMASSLVQTAAALLYPIASSFDSIANTMLNALLAPINALRALVGMAPLSAHINTSGLVRGAYDGAAGLQNQALAAYSAPRGTTSGTVIGKTPNGGRAKGLAEGAIVTARPGGVFANIGEGRHDEIVMPITPENMSRYGFGGGGGSPITVVIESKGGIDLSQYIDVKIKQKDAADALIHRLGRKAR